jgi:hypothetical protein
LRREGEKAHFATPYRGQSKPIERAFRTVIELFSRGRETYTGSNKEPGVVPVLDGIDYYNEQTGGRAEGGGDGAGRGGLSVGRVAGTGAAGYQ